MIAYSQLGKFGNLGNQLFEICSLAGLSRKYNKEWKIPLWNPSGYFEKAFPITSRFKDLKPLPEKAYHFTPEYWNEHLTKNENFDISGWLQSEKNWDCDKNFAKDLFKFEQKSLNALKNRYPQAFEKPTIAISIRRGDFVGNSNYDLLPIEYYIGALWKYFPDYHNYNIFIFSDDIPYCKHHFQCLDNVFFPRNEGPIQQLILMAQCDHFIISQSTFSWWGAYLGEKEYSIVVRPNYNTAGKLLESLSEKDYWPESWINIYDHKKEKIDLSDVTFTIPVFYDHEDRAQNLRLSIQYLEKYNTKIIIGEQGGLHFSKTFPQHRYIPFPYSKFHRTKMLNEMALLSDTDIIANWDADVILNPMQIIETVKLIKSGDDMVYPYDGRFARVNRKNWYTKIRDNDTAVLSREIFNGMRPHDALSVGGAVFFKKKSFIEGGMENENFISYAPEDQERFYRFNKLGYKVKRVKGPLYHIDHFVGNNSWTQHSDYKANEKEFFRIRDIQDLQSEISKWPWYKPYTNKYYDEIKDGSTKSRDEVFKLEEFQHIESILDLGCGIGQWGKDLNIPYTGIDFNIPKDMLLIPESNYIEWDIMSDTIPNIGDFDLGLCLEVMEHIPEEYVERTIKFLTSKCKRVLFSAAIPGQGGVGHCNEQWQTYWSKIFEKFSYFPMILNVRNNQDIEIWYRNNMILFVNYDTGERISDYIHPKLYTNIVGTITNWERVKPY